MPPTSNWLTTSRPPSRSERRWPRSSLCGDVCVYLSHAIAMACNMLCRRSTPAQPINLRTTMNQTLTRHQDSRLIAGDVTGMPTFHRFERGGLRSDGSNPVRVSCGLLRLSSRSCQRLLRDAHLLRLLRRLQQLLRRAHLSTSLHRLQQLLHSPLLQRSHRLRQLLCRRLLRLSSRCLQQLLHRATYYAPPIVSSSYIAPAYHPAYYS